MKKDFKKYSCAGLLYVTVVYELQFMNILNSVFGVDQDTSNKTREFTKGDKKKVRAAGMCNLNVISYTILNQQPEPRKNFDCSHCGHPPSKKVTFFFNFCTVSAA